ncbi:MAG: amidohydrolase [Ferrimicrobium sp.]
MQQITRSARSCVEENKDELLGASHEIHDHPELRFEEHRASALLCEILTRHGFVVEKGLAGMATAFRGSFSVGEGGPRIAVFAEYDALAGVGHACGHNIIATAGVGAAVAAADLLSSMDGVNGTVVCLGSPGEEGGGGKVRLIEAGELADLDAAVMIHPADSDKVVRPNLGRLSLEVTFSGKASHAASAPEMGLNALDAATLFLVAIGLLRQQLRSNSRVHAIVLEGGEAVNVIPERTRLRVFVRSPDPTYLQERLLQSVYDCAHGAALATGTQAEIAEVAPAYLSMRSNSVIAGVCYDAFTAVGRHPGDPLVTASEASSAGSTDMGNVSRVVPAVHPYIGIAPGLAGHTREFEEAAGGLDGEAAVLDGAAILAATVVKLISDTDLLSRAKMEFDRTETT